MELFISSYEFNDFEKVREITSFHKMVIEGRNVLQVRISDPVIGQKYGLKDKDIEILYLINRVDETAFQKFNKFPIDVHVLFDPKPSSTIPSSITALQHIAWACLYNNKKDAKKHRIM